jgi:hypothetical protein
MALGKSMNKQKFWAAVSVIMIASVSVQAQTGGTRDRLKAEKCYTAEGKAVDCDAQAKADAAVQWCKHASDYAQSVSGKPWKYLLIPHDAVREDKRLVDYLQYQQA